METQKDRLFLFIEASGLSVRAFERELGVATGTIRKMSDTPSANLYEKLSAKFPQLSRDWVMFGTGAMLTPNNQVSVGDPSNGEGMQNVSGNYNSVGVPQKKFSHEEEWFALVAEKDKQIEKLLQEMTAQRQDFMELLKSK